MDHERFASLVLPHTQAMAKVAAVLIGVADAEDATQEALVRAWNGWAALREEGAIRSWLLRITVNVCHNWQSGHFGTHRSRTQPLSPDMGMPDSDSLAAMVPGTTEHADALDLRLAVTLLPAPVRAVVALRFYAGMDATEIGAALDLPASTVRTRLRRALLLLRDYLAADCEQTTPPKFPPVFSTTEFKSERR
ncbi:MAG: RNA polymerase sigma factor [Ktedonobacterales bacterium]